MKGGKKVKRRRIYMLMLTVLCLLLGTTHAFAADERLGTIVDGSLLTDNASAEFVVNPLARGAFLSNGTGSISIVGGRKISAAGSTTCYYSVDNLNVSLCVERLVGNKWVNVYAGPVASAKNTYRVSTSKTYSVAGGYYYRVTGAHSASDDGAYESCASYTDGIWID